MGKLSWRSSLHNAFPFVIFKSQTRGVTFLHLPTSVRSLGDTWCLKLHLWYPRKEIRYLQSPQPIHMMVYVVEQLVEASTRFTVNRYTNGCGYPWQGRSSRPTALGIVILTGRLGCGFGAGENKQKNLGCF